MTHASSSREHRNERVAHDPRAEHARLRTIDAERPIYIIVCCGRARLSFDATMQCTWCGRELVGEVYEAEANPLNEQPADVCTEVVADYDIVAIAERIKAQREINEVSLSTLGELIAVRVDRLCRFEAGQVQDAELPELLRALVWSAGCDPTVITAYRKPSAANAEKAEAANV